MVSSQVTTRCSASLFLLQIYIYFNAGGNTVRKSPLVKTVRKKRRIFLSVERREYFSGRMGESTLREMKALTLLGCETIVYKHRWKTLPLFQR